jgi:hypothetical protein
MKLQNRKFYPTPQTNKCTASHSTPPLFIFLFLLLTASTGQWSVFKKLPTSCPLRTKQLPRSPPIDFYFFSLASLQTVHTCTQEIPYHGSFGTKTLCTSCFIHVIFTHILSAILFVFLLFCLTILHQLRMLQAAYGFNWQDEIIVKHTQKKAATHFRTYSYTRHRLACKN